MRPKKTPLRQCAGCGQMKPKKELVRVVRAPLKEDGEGNPLPPEISLDPTGKRPGRGAYLCRDAQCLKLAKKSRRLERSFSWYEPEDLIGKTLAAIVNLPPRKMMGLESCGMLLSAVHKEKGEEALHLMILDDSIPAGAKLC